jgi:hypothetical protein
LGWVDAALVDPFLDAVEVDWGDVEGETEDFRLDIIMLDELNDKKTRVINSHILIPIFSVNNMFRCLTTRKPSRYFAVLLLTLMTPSRCLSLS